MTEPVTRIRIIAVPPGEAPFWVREKWVGLELPLAKWAVPKKYLGVGVMSGPRSCFSQLWHVVRGRAEAITGYAVEAGAAVDILAASSPEAGSWWQENAPQLISPKRKFVFHA